jgi:hypothetical protein
LAVSAGINSNRQIVVWFEGAQLEPCPRVSTFFKRKRRQATGRSCEKSKDLVRAKPAKLATLHVAQQRKLWVYSSSQPASPAQRAAYRLSIPKISLVILNPVFPQKRQEFLFIVELVMVFFLMTEGSTHRIAPRWGLRRFADILPTACAGGLHVGSPASLAWRSECRDSRAQLQAVPNSVENKSGLKPLRVVEVYGLSRFSTTTAVP